jgi:hypothetical protein
VLFEEEEETISVTRGRMWRCSVYNAKKECKRARLWRGCLRARPYVTVWEGGREGGREGERVLAEDRSVCNVAVCHTMCSSSSCISLL